MFAHSTNAGGPLLQCCERECECVCACAHVCRDGVVVEEGSHDHLMSLARGIYKEMWERQVGGLGGCSLVGWAGGW